MLSTKDFDGGNAALRSMDIETLDARRWEAEVEPEVVDLVARAGPRLRRGQAQIGPLVLEFVGDDDRAFQFFSNHWVPARQNQAADLYCYVFAATSVESRGPRSGVTDEPAASARVVTCPDSGRALLLGAKQYRLVRETCKRLVQATTARCGQSLRAASIRQTAHACLVSGACVEYQPERRETVTVLLLGPPAAGKLLQAYQLTRCKAENSLVCGDLAWVQTSGVVTATETRLWMRTRLVRNCPALLAWLAMGPAEAVELSEPLAAELSRYRDAADLARGLESGTFSDRLAVELESRLAAASEGCSLVDPRLLLGPERSVEQAQLTDLVCLSSDLDSNSLLRVVSADEFISRCSAGVRAVDDEPTETEGTLSLETLLCQLCATLNPRVALLNSRLPPAQTQLCLRYYLEGLCDSVRILDARDVAPSDPLVSAMRLEIQPRGPSPDTGRHGPAICQGPREVELVSFEKDGDRVEAVALGRWAEGFAQVAAVWPGQVADFFSRHDSLRLGDLFTETRNGPWRSPTLRELALTGS